MKFAVFINFLAIGCIENLDAVIISKSECGTPFTCPDKCTVLWEGTCPTECVCPKKNQECFEVMCPAGPPKCITYTKHDGCQDCACEEPYRQIHIQNMRRLILGDDYKPTNVTEAPKIYISDEIQKNSNFDQHERESQPPVPQTINDHHLKCSEEHEREIVRNFGALGEELDEIGQLSASSALFPPIFAFSKGELKKRCQVYNLAHQRTSFAAKRNCFNDYPLYYRLYYAFSYACGFGTEPYFARYFDCWQSLRFDPRIVACEARLAGDMLLDRRQACLGLNDVARCSLRHVVRTCGWEGWQVYAQFLSLTAKTHSRSCRLDRGGDRQNEIKVTLSPDYAN